jgi:hypothetical protein
VAQDGTAGRGLVLKALLLLLVRKGIVTLYLGSCGSSWLDAML